MSAAKLTAAAVAALFLAVLFLASGTVTAALSLAETTTGRAAPIITGAPGASGSPESGAATSDASGCVTTGSPATHITTVAGYDTEQMANAATIIAVGRQNNVPERGLVVAIAAAITESGLRNVNHGDRDSLGLFQQRPSQGWGTPAQVMNPTYAATQFYRHLLAVPDWRRLSVTQAAQAVQRSGLPNAYAAHERAAYAITAAARGLTCTPASRPGTPAGTPEPEPRSAHPEPAAGAGGCGHVRAPTAAALAAVTYACAQLGKPYVWGGNGDPGFDCSGLTHAAYTAAGITLPRTAQTQYQARTPLPAGTSPQPGDLLFFGTPGNVSHVAISLGGNTMIHAPTFGQPVQLADLRTQRQFLAASRPSTPMGSQ